uniref:Uncharacterized protein n=1 Tax=Oryza nivara TaxID=4536 RepID=A0A0E0HSS0_ORYNI
MGLQPLLKIDFISNPFVVTSKYPSQYCCRTLASSRTAPLAPTPPLLELELSQTVSAPPKLGVELGGALSQNGTSK